MSNETVSYEDFLAVELRTGTIVDVQNFPEARKPAYIITVDFGHETGRKKTSSQITDLYKPEDLLNKQIIGAVNLPPKQVGPHISEFLLTGFIQKDNSVVLAVPDKHVENGLKQL